MNETVISQHRNYYYFSNKSIRNTCKEVKDYKIVKAGRALKKAGNSNTNSSTTNPPKHVSLSKRKLLKYRHCENDN